MSAFTEWIEDTNEMSQIIRKDILPNLIQHVNPFTAINFINYLSAVESCQKDNVFFHYYIHEPLHPYDIKILSKYKDRCVGMRR